MHDVGDKVEMMGAYCCAAPFLLVFGGFYMMGKLVKGCVCAPCIVAGDAILSGFVAK